MQRHRVVKGHRKVERNSSVSARNESTDLQLEEEGLHASTRSLGSILKAAEN